MKRSILVAALTAFLLSLSLQTSEAQIIQFQRCGTCQTFQRPRLFPRLFGFWAYPNYQQTTKRGCVGGNCPVADPRPATCSDGSCSTDEYIPTEDGNVPVDDFYGCASDQRERVDGPERELVTGSRAVAAVNAVRARWGLSPLVFDAVLERGALYQANVCRSYGSLIHASGVAEILAQNSSDFDGAIRQWLNSPAHFAILMSGRYTRCGIGQVRDGYGRVWYAVQFR